MGQREDRLGKKPLQPLPPGGDLGEDLGISLGVATMPPLTKVLRESDGITG